MNKVQPSTNCTALHILLPTKLKTNNWYKAPNVGAGKNTATKRVEKFFFLRSLCAQVNWKQKKLQHVYLWINYRCGGKSEVLSSQLPKHHGTFPGGIGHSGEEKEKSRWQRRKEWKRAGNTNMITTVAGAQVITAVKRSPASPEANEPLSSFHLCRGGSVICRLQVRSGSHLSNLLPE